MRIPRIPGTISGIAVLFLGLSIADDSKTSPSSAPNASKIYGEWRIRVKPDKGTEYAQLIKEKGLPLFREAGGRMVGWWTTLIGDLYEHVTIWEFDGMPGFEKAIQFLGKEERFSGFVKLRDPLLSGEESRFLRLAASAEKPSLPEAGKFFIHEIHRVPLHGMKAYLSFMEREIPILKKHGFRPVGPWQTAVGSWSEVTYLFRFESLAERDQLISAFMADEEGNTYNQKVSELVEEITTRLVVPAGFAQ
jgi:hypothetical protein